MTIIGWGLITIGFFIIFSGIIGLYRLPDFYTKLHGAGVIEACGIPTCLFGLACLQSSWLNVCKLLFANVLILVLSPVASQALAKASLTQDKKHNSTCKSLLVKDKNG